MNIAPVNYNRYNNYPQNYQQRPSVAFTANNTNLFKPVKKQYTKLVLNIREHYFKKMINSKAMEWFLNKTDKVENMSTHMMVAGSTLISGMYAIRTLNNDNLDKHKRHTLALNDCLTWGLSTIAAYTVDKALNKKWEGATRRFTAEYIKKHTDPEYIKSFNENEAKIKAECKAKGIPYNAPEFNPNELVLKCRENNITPYNLNQRILEEANKRSVEILKIDLKNKRIAKLNASLPKNKQISPLEQLPAIKNVKVFNVEVLKWPALTNKIKGMDAIKKIFIFGMMYRYVVPVLVMKPANKIGAYIHKKNEEKQQMKNA